jgi:hypothetical protein
MIFNESDPPKNHPVQKNEREKYVDVSKSKQKSKKIVWSIIPLKNISLTPHFSNR